MSMTKPSSNTSKSQSPATSGQDSTESDELALHITQGGQYHLTVNIVRIISTQTGEVMKTFTAVEEDGAVVFRPVDWSTGLLVEESPLERAQREMEFAEKYLGKPAPDSRYERRKLKKLKQKYFKEKPKMVVLDIETHKMP